MNLEMNIRKALEDEASGYTPPDDLAHRTAEAARALPEPTFADRLRARRDARATHGRVTGYPKWAYAGAAAAVLVALFAVGRTVTRPVSETLRARASAVPGAALGKAATSAGPSGSAAVTAPGSAPARPPVSSQPAIVPPEPVPAPGTLPPQLVRTADVEVRIHKGTFDRQWARANDIAASHGGYVTGSSTESDRGKIARGTVTIRVPSDRLQATIADLRRLGTLTHLTTSGIDVSGQLVDFDARIRNAQAQEAQLLDLLRQARTLSDTIAIRAQLDQVRQEIEQLQGQRTSLQNQVDFATLNAAIYEPEAAPKPSPLPTTGIGRAWNATLHAVVTMVAGLVLIAGPLALLAALGLIGWGLVRLARRRTV